MQNPLKSYRQQQDEEEEEDEQEVEIHLAKSFKDYLTLSVLAYLTTPHTQPSLSPSPFAPFNLSAAL